VAEAAFGGRAGLQQRVLPAYRAAFVERLAQACQGGLEVFTGRPRPGEGILEAEAVQGAQWYRGRNLHLPPGTGGLLWQPDLVEWLRRSDPDALVLEANPRYLSNRAAMRWMKQRGRPVIGWGLGAPPSSGPRAWLRGRYLAAFDGLIAYSRLGADQYRAAGVPPDRVYVAPNAVVSPPNKLPRRPAWSGRPARVLFVGRLQPRKRVDRLIWACSQIEPAPELWVVGDGPARPKLERLAAALPGVRFYGAMAGEALRELFQAADVFVLPGTGGLAVQEAMAHGLPVIVAEADGSQRDLVASDAGWLIPPRDDQALLETLREALGDAKRLRRMGRAAYDRVKDRFHVGAMVAVFVQALNDAAPGRG
jgi:glycosyltransferase involved in cell wall biosynthesis